MPHNLARAFSIMLLATLALFPVTPAASSSPRPPLAVVTQLATNQRVVALTFDDGPSLFTPQILSVLHAFHAHATFFEIGIHVLQFPQISREVVRAGDEIGNHTYTHVDLRFVSDQTMHDELTETQRAVTAATGVPPVWFRPPYGGIDPRVAAAATYLGLHPILWSVDPRDWARPGTGAIIQTVLQFARPGSVVIMHDGGGDRSETVGALRIILATLRKEGYRFPTLSEMFHLPAATSCDTRSAARWFAADRIPPIITTPIYRTWLAAYCRGDNYGPATGPQFALTSNVIAQDFARTARRLEWIRSSGSIRVELMWSWAIAIFARHGIQPRWHTRITRAWFDQYFHGQNWGRALTGAHRVNGYHIQCFLRGCAVSLHNHVSWKRN